MNLTLTGASGFLGRVLAARLDASGHTVHMLGRAPRAGMPPSARMSLWDPNLTAPPRESLRDADAVVHLAGEPVAQRWTPEVKRRIRDSRVEGTRRLVQGMAECGRPPAALICASAVGYYGNRGDEILREPAAPGQGFLSDVCVEWEGAAREAEQLGVRVVCVRIGVVLGRDGGALEKMLLPFKLGVGGRMGSGKQWMPWIHIEDICRLFQWAAENPNVKGPLNGASPNPVTNSEFSDSLGRALRRPAILPVPQAAIRLLYGEMSRILFDSQRVIPAAAAEAGFEFRHPAIYPALKDLLG